MPNSQEVLEAGLASDYWKMGKRNPHITAFMERKKPITPVEKIENKKKITYDETQTLIAYPKNMRDTILLCAPPPCRPPHRPQPSLPLSDAWISFVCFFARACRKHMNMKMAVKTEKDVMPKIEPPEVYGRLKSDITYGKERIYERSYY